MRALKTRAVKKQAASMKATPSNGQLRTFCAGKDEGDKVTCIRIIKVDKVVEEARLTDVDGKKLIELLFTDGRSFKVVLAGNGIKQIQSSYLTTLGVVQRENLDFLKNKKVENIVVNPGNEEYGSKNGFLLFICGGGDRLAVDVLPGSIKSIES